MMALSLKAWGGTFDPRDGVWTPKREVPERSALAWRYASVVFGTLTLPALYALARVLFGSRVVAAAAAIMLAMDGVFFVHSRIAMTNIFTVFFITGRSDRGGALFAASEGPVASAGGDRPGVCCRLALVEPVCLGDNRISSGRPLAAPHLPATIYPAQGCGQTAPASECSRVLACTFCLLIAVPFVIYFATYIPNVLQGRAAPPISCSPGRA
jgi:hypothetical protein